MVLHKYQLSKTSQNAFAPGCIFKGFVAVGVFQKILSEILYPVYLNFKVTILNTTHNTVTIQNLVTIFDS